MNLSSFKSSISFSHRLISACVALIFFFSLINPYIGYAQSFSSGLNLPQVGTILTSTSGFTPPLIKGVIFHPENPLLFDFIIHPGDKKLQKGELAKETIKMVKYFMATLTTPEEDLWVNLSPYEKDRIIPEKLSQTTMGRDLLAMDYILKQLTASLLYPENTLGSQFWARVYQRAYQEYGTTDIPINTFNKIWIVPESARLYQKNNSVFVLNSRLKVMLDEDYLSMVKSPKGAAYNDSLSAHEKGASFSKIQTEIIREIILPEIEKEVNDGELFANLREMYNAMILATWYKINLKESLLGKIYVDQNKIIGVNVSDKGIKEKIYQQYLKALSQGVYNYIKEDFDPATQTVIPRKFFSGGITALNEITKIVSDPTNLASSREAQAVLAEEGEQLSFSFTVGLDEVGPNVSPGDLKGTQDEGFINGMPISSQSRPVVDYFSDQAQRVSSFLIKKPASTGSLTGPKELGTVEFNRNGRLEWRGLSGSKLDQLFKEITALEVFQTGALQNIQIKLITDQSLPDLSQDGISYQPMVELVKTAEGVILKLHPIFVNPEQFLADEDLSPETLQSVLKLALVNSLWKVLGYDEVGLSTVKKIEANAVLRNMVGKVLSGQANGFVFEKRLVRDYVRNHFNDIMASADFSKGETLRLWFQEHKTNPDFDREFRSIVIENLYKEKRAGYRRTADWLAKEFYGAIDGQSITNILEKDENGISKIIEAFKNRTAEQQKMMLHALSGIRGREGTVTVTMLPEDAGISRDEFYKQLVEKRYLYRSGFPTDKWDADDKQYAKDFSTFAIRNGYFSKVRDVFRETQRDYSVKLREGAIQVLDGIFEVKFSDWAATNLGSSKMQRGGISEDEFVPGEVMTVTVNKAVKFDSNVKVTYYSNARRTDLRLKQSSQDQLEAKFSTQDLDGYMDVETVMTLDGQKIVLARRYYREATEFKVDDLAELINRGEVLKEGFGYYKDKIESYLEEIRQTEAKNVDSDTRRVKANLVRFIDSVGQYIERKISNAPVERAWPVLKAVTLMSKSNREALLKFLDEASQSKNGEIKPRSKIADAIQIMYDRIPSDWVQRNASAMKGKVVYSLSAENSLIAGGLGYVMQVHEKFLREFGAIVIPVEVVYQNVKDPYGGPLKKMGMAGYVKEFNIDPQSLELLGSGHHTINGISVNVRYWRGNFVDTANKVLKTGLFIEEVSEGEKELESGVIPEGGKAVKFSNVIYDYNKYGNHSDFEFTAFYAQAGMELLTLVEQKRRNAEGDTFQPAGFWGNDSQTAGLMAKLSIEVVNDSDESVFKKALIAFTTHTFGNRMFSSVQASEWVLGTLFGLPRKYWSAALNPAKPNLIDMASLASNLAAYAQGVVHTVSRKHTEVNKAHGVDPYVHTVATSNGDDLNVTRNFIRKFYRDLYQKELPDVEDLKENQIKAIGQQAGRELKAAFIAAADAQGEKANRYQKNAWKAVDFSKPTMWIAGRLVWVKMSPGRMFTRNNILSAIKSGHNVVMLTRVQSYAESTNLRDMYNSILEEIDRAKSNPQLDTKNWGAFVFTEWYTDEQKQLLMIAGHLEIPDSDHETGTNEWTEINGALAYNWVMAPPWVTWVSPWKVIRGEGTIAEVNELDINMTIPRDLNGLSPAQVEDIYLNTALGVLKNLTTGKDEDEQQFFEAVKNSGRLAQIVHGGLTGGVYLTEWNEALIRRDRVKNDVDGLIKNFIGDLKKEHKSDLEKLLAAVLLKGRNGAVSFGFNVDGIDLDTLEKSKQVVIDENPWLKELITRAKVSDSQFIGLADFLLTKFAIERLRYDGVVAHLHHGDYSNYIKGLFSGIYGSYELIEWLKNLEVQDISTLSKDRVVTYFFSELTRALANEYISPDQSEELQDPSQKSVSQDKTEPVPASSITDLPEANDVGGINLNPQLLDLQIKRDDSGLPLPVWQQPVEVFAVEGFIPVILNVRQANIPQLLGFIDKEQPYNSAETNRSPEMVLSWCCGTRQKIVL